MELERLTQNPHLDNIPDHARQHYDTVRAILVNTGISNKEAIKTLNASWTLSHQERIQTWDLQVAEDEVAQHEQRWSKKIRHEPSRN